MEIENIIKQAKQIAVKPFNVFGHTITVNRAKSLNITVDGPVVVKRDIIIVPIDIFHFNTFKSEKRNIVLYRDSLKVKERY